MICQNCGLEFTPARGEENRKLCPKCFIQKLNHLASNPHNPGNDPKAEGTMNDQPTDKPITDTGTGEPQQPTIPQEPTPSPPSEAPSTPQMPSTPPPTPGQTPTPGQESGEETPGQGEGEGQGGSTPPAQPGA